DGIRDFHVTGVQTCALPIWRAAGSNPRAALRTGTFAATLLALAGTYIYCLRLLPGDGIRVFYSVGAGLIIGVIIGLLTEYYTSADYAPVKGIAESSLTGTATNDRKSVV